jgi:phenylacetaldehyde dehydrogenase
MKPGPGMDPAAEMGPLVAEEQLDRVWGYVESGFAEGARALSGGRKMDPFVSGCDRDRTI